MQVRVRVEPAIAQIRLGYNALPHAVNATILHIVLTQMVLLKTFFRQTIFVILLSRRVSRFQLARRPATLRPSMAQTHQLQ